MNLFTIGEWLFFRKFINALVKVSVSKYNRKVILPLVQSSRNEDSLAVQASDALEYPNTLNWT